MTADRGAVIVTGGAGYVGSHACRCLAGAGFTPVVLDDLSAGHRELVRWGPLEVGDIRQAGWVEGQIRRHQAVAVMHFAARTSVAESVRRPGLYRSVNVRGTRIVLEAMVRCGVRHLVLSSSAAVYGAPTRVPVPETAVLRPTSPYGATKRAAERLAGAWQREDHGRAVIFRYFNAAGAEPSGAAGEWHQPETHLLPLALAASRGGEPLVLHGDDYGTPDGTCIRDFVHVADLAEAHRLGLEASLAGTPLPPLNLGTGAGCSVRALLAAIGRVTGREVPYRVGSRRPADPPRLVAAPGRARRLLRWRAVSGLDAMIDSADHWLDVLERGGPTAGWPAR